MRVNPSAAIEDLQIRERLAPFGIAPTERQAQQIREYARLLLFWNRSINLTAVTDPAEIVERHFGESMYGANLLPVENCRLADVGSGAGFPGLAMRIACTSIQLTLIESNKKKCAFLSEVVRSLELRGVEIVPERFENVRPDEIEADIVTSRAVGSLKELLRWSGAALATRGHVMLWVGADDSARTARTKGWFWQPPQRIPGSMGRFILRGRRFQQSIEGG